MKKLLAKISVAILLLTFADQLTKIIAQDNFMVPFRVVGDFFTLSYVENFGIAFGIPIPIWLTILTNILLIIAIIYITLKEVDLSKKIVAMPFILIIAGALGNLIDRILNGFVIDFISIWKYPSFNLADIYICLAVLLVVIFYAKIKKVTN